MRDDDLYYRIDQDDEMSDKEKRDAYFSSLEEEDMREEWEDSF